MTQLLTCPICEYDTAALYAARQHDCYLCTDCLSTEPRTCPACEEDGVCLIPNDNPDYPELCEQCLHCDDPTPPKNPCEACQIEEAQIFPVQRWNYEPVWLCGGCRERLEER